MMRYFNTSGPCDLAKHIYTYILRIRFDPLSQLPPVKKKEE